MGEDDKDSKTEEPTSKKLDNARQDGNVAQSQEIKSLMILIGALVMVAVMAPALTASLARKIRSLLEHANTFHMDIESLHELLVILVLNISWMLLLPISMFVALALIGCIGQYGLMWAPKKVAPDLKKIDPISGAKRMFSMRMLFEGAKGIFKVTLVATLVWIILSPHLGNPERLMAQDIIYTLKDLHHLLVLLMIAVVVTVAFIAVADFAYQKHKFHEDQKMTKQEVKDEHKNSEGDPQVKSRIRSLRMERFRGRMMAAVPEASVVVTNPTHFAVALKYDIDTMTAPVLVAKGQDYIALKIREIAEDNDVPVVENPPLARGLYAAVEIDQEIPPEHYKAVAEIIGYVMRLKKAAS